MPTSTTSSASVPRPYPPRRVLVLGGTGFVGRAFAEHWHRTASGDSTLLMPTRRWRNSAALRHLPRVEVRQADVWNDAVLTDWVSQADAVVNLVAILQGSAADFERAHVTWAERVSAACRKAGVQRLVHVSALGVGRGDPSNYLRTKAAAESLLQASTLDVRILRPSVIFGAEDRFLNTFAQLQRLAPVVPLAGAHAKFAPVWVGDVAHAIQMALCESTPAVVDCAGPKTYTLAELVRLAGLWSGHARPVIPLPLPVATLQALVMECLPGEPLLSRDNLASMQVPNIPDGSTPGLQALGIEPQSLESIGPSYLGSHQGCGAFEPLRQRAGRLPRR